MVDYVASFHYLSFSLSLFPRMSFSREIKRREREREREREKEELACNEMEVYGELNYKVPIAAEHIKG
jgi:hypothetical protein